MITTRIVCYRVLIIAFFFSALIRERLLSVWRQNIILLTLQSSLDSLNSHEFSVKRIRRRCHHPQCCTPWKFQWISSSVCATNKCCHQAQAQQVQLLTVQKIPESCQKKDRKNKHMLVHACHACTCKYCTCHTAHANKQWGIVKRQTATACFIYLASNHCVVSTWPNSIKFKSILCGINMTK